MSRVDSVIDKVLNAITENPGLHKTFACYVRDALKQEFPQQIVEVEKATTGTPETFDGLTFKVYYDSARHCYKRELNAGACPKIQSSRAPKPNTAILSSELVKCTVEQYVDTCRKFNTNICNIQRYFCESLQKLHPNEISRCDRDDWKQISKVKIDGVTVAKYYVVAKDAVEKWKRESRSSGGDVIAHQQEECSEDSRDDGKSASSGEAVSSDVLSTKQPHVEKPSSAGIDSVGGPSRKSLASRQWCQNASRQWCQNDDQVESLVPTHHPTPVDASVAALTGHGEPKAQKHSPFDCSDTPIPTYDYTPNEGPMNASVGTMAEETIGVGDVIAFEGDVKGKLQRATGFSHGVPGSSIQVSKLSDGGAALKVSAAPAQVNREHMEERDKVCDAQEQQNGLSRAHSTDTGNGNTEPREADDVSASVGGSAQETIGAGDVIQFKDPANGNLRMSTVLTVFPNRKLISLSGDVFLGENDIVRRVGKCEPIRAGSDMLQVRRKVYPLPPCWVLLGSMELKEDTVTLDQLRTLGNNGKNFIRNLEKNGNENAQLDNQVPKRVGTKRAHSEDVEPPSPGVAAINVSNEASSEPTRHKKRRTNASTVSDLPKDATPTSTAAQAPDDTFAESHQSYDDPTSTQANGVSTLDAISVDSHQSDSISVDSHQNDSPAACPDQVTSAAEVIDIVELRRIIVNEPSAEIPDAIVRYTNNGKFLKESPVLISWAGDRYKGSNGDGKDFLRDHASAAKDAEETLEVLLSNHADPHLASPNGQTPLFAAVAEGNDVAVSALLDKVPYDEEQLCLHDKDGETVFHSAIRHGKYGCFETLLEKCKLSPRAVLELVLDTRGENVLFALARYTDVPYSEDAIASPGGSGSLKVLTKLLDIVNTEKLEGPLIHKNENGETVMAVAAMSGRLFEVEEISKIELGCGRSIGNKCKIGGDRQIQSPLDLACETQQMLQDAKTSADALRQLQERCIGSVGNHLGDSDQVVNWAASGLEPTIEHLKEIEKPVKVGSLEELSRFVENKPESQVTNTQILTKVAQDFKKKHTVDAKKNDGKLSLKFDLPERLQSKDTEKTKRKDANDKMRTNLRRQLQGMVRKPKVIPEVGAYIIRNPKDPCILTSTAANGEHYGLFAIDNVPNGVISKGTIVCEYGGLVRRDDEGGDDANDTLYAAELKQLDLWSEKDSVPQFHLDAGKKFNEASLLNDNRCNALVDIGEQEPRATNVAFMEVKVDKWPKLFLVTTEDIPSTSELLLNYGDDYWGAIGKKLLAKTVAEKEEILESKQAIIRENKSLKTSLKEVKDRNVNLSTVDLT